MHQSGINIRHMGHVRSGVLRPDLRKARLASLQLSLLISLSLSLDLSLSLELSLISA